MKKQLLKYLSVCCAISCACSITFENLAISAPAAVALAKTKYAQDKSDKSYFTAFFNTRNTKDFFHIHDFLRKIAQYAPEVESFIDQPIEKLDAQALYDVIQAHINDFPEEIRELFPEAEQFKMIVNEKIAMSYCEKLLAAPLKEVPQWTDFVDTITQLLQENSRTKDFVKSLQTVRKRGTSWRDARPIFLLKVGTTLKKYLPLLPQHLQTVGKKTSKKDLAARIKV